MQTSSIVAVASAARDLEAVVELLSGLPAAAEHAFIIVQHPEPGRRYRPLEDLLAERINHPVVAARNGIRPERGHVYVMRADVELRVINGLINMSPATTTLQHPGDILFDSLAADLGSRAVGVVLSGGGSDGARGVRAIYRAGGSTFAQYPGSARFPSMPISAIETRCTRSVLRPNEIARELVRPNSSIVQFENSDCPRRPLQKRAIPG